jgi:hypothetical protein
MLTGFHKFETLGKRASPSESGELLENVWSLERVPYLA